MYFLNDQKSVNMLTVLRPISCTKGKWQKIIGCTPLEVLFYNRSTHNSTLRTTFKFLYFRYKPPTSDNLQTENIQISSPKNDEHLAHAIIRGLKPGVYYQFWVSAVNHLNNEGPTSIVQGYRHERRRNVDLEASRGRRNAPSSKIRL